MSDKRFIPMTHLHTHTPKGSLLDGYMRIPDVIKLAQSWGMDSIGISDHGSLAAHKEFYDQVKEAGLHPVLGMEAYITPNREYKNEQFNDVIYEEIELTEDQDSRYYPKYAFEIVSQEEFDASNNLTLINIENMRTKSKLSEMEREMIKFLSQEVKNNLDEDDPIPKPTALKKMAIAYKESLTSIGKIIAVKGDATLKNYFSWHPRLGHLLLIAKNDEGYRNLLKLNTIGQFEGFYKKPRIDYEDIKKYGKGIVASTACLGSISSRLILNGHLEEAKEHIRFLEECFDELFLEIQPSRQKDQHIVNEQLIKWSEEMNIPLLATSDVHMVTHEELPVHEAITNIGKANHKDSGDNDISVYDTAYFMSPEEILGFGIPQQALQNAYDLSHRCNVTYLEDREWKFPEYEVPEGYNFDTYLEKLAREGLFEYFMNVRKDIDTNLYQNRLYYELDIIKQKNLSAYFIIVWDYVNFARKNNILISPGRGSGAGSLVLMALKITQPDPIEYDLLFERKLYMRSLNSVKRWNSYVRKTRIRNVLSKFKSKKDT